MNYDLIQRFKTSLPMVRQWIDGLLSQHSVHARPIDTLGFKRLPAYFPEEVLQFVKVVMVPQVPYPPVRHLGLQELELKDQLSLAGITFKEVIFIQNNCASESLYFHELIHVIQWGELGMDRFLLTYGLGLIQFGYKHCPLEEMAYLAQRDFDNGTFIKALKNLVETRTDAIWRATAPILQGAGI